MLSVLANVPIPPFLDFVLVAPLTDVTLTGPWFAPHEVFLIDSQGDRGNYFGQRLSSAGDEQWAIRGGVHWHAGGTKITWGEWLGPQQTDSRIHVGEFTNLTPGQPLPIQPTPTPPWAPLVKDLAVRPARIHAKLAGKSSGTAVLNFRGRLIKGRFTVSFQEYSSDGEHVLNGSMAVDVEKLGTARIFSDIQLSGMHTGFVKIDLTLAGKSISGTAVSEKDGIRYEKIFTKQP